MGHVCFLSDQGRFTVDGSRGGFDPGFEGFKCIDFLFVHVALLGGSDIGQGACVLDQGGFAGLQLAQLLAHGFDSRNEKAAWSK